jgi:hypothetical protein
VNDGEVIKVTSTDQENNGGLPFRVSSFGNFRLGTEAGGGIEYIKIRIRNNSPSTKLTLGAGVAFGGSSSIDSRTFGTLNIEANSSEWKTYTFSMKSLNYDTQVARGNATDHRWTSDMREFVIFPFGQGVDNEAIEGEQYYMEIDYVVMGTLSYVTGYESALEKKEKSATEFEFVSKPTTTTFYTGDRLDLSGLEAKITFNGNESQTETVTSASAVYNFEKPADLDDSVKSWKTPVKLTYGSLSLTYEVTVIDIENIEFATEQTTDVYNKVDILKAGEFIPEGMTIKVNYADGTSKIKQLHEITLTGDDFAAQNVPLNDKGYYPYIVTANFYGHTITFPVNLIDVKEIVLTPVEDKKNSVYYGTAIGTDFFNVVCRYTDGSEKALADSGLASYFSVACDTNIAGGAAIAKASLKNDAYEINVTADVEVTVQKPTSLTASCSQSGNVKVDSVIANTRFTINYVYADGTKAKLNNEDPKLVINYDTSAPGEKTGKVKIDGYVAEFNYTVKEVAEDDMKNEFIRDGGKVELLKGKFPTSAIVAIVIAIVVVLVVGAYCLLKFVFKVEFKRKKRVSLDDIF